MSIPGDSYSPMPNRRGLETALVILEALWLPKAMTEQHTHLKQALRTLRQALEETESALLKSEEALTGDSSLRPKARRNLELLSVAEVCQELGMGKSWVHRRLKSGEIPSVRLGNNIKVKREDLQEYLERSRYHPPGAEVALMREG